MAATEEKMSTLMEMGVPQNANQEATVNKVDEEVTALIRDLYYVAQEEHIMGPFKAAQIFSLFIAGQILPHSPCWVQNVGKGAAWCEINFSGESDNKQLKEEYEILYDYIQERLDSFYSQKLERCMVPTHIPTDEESIIQLLLSAIGGVVWWVLVVVLFVHALPSIAIVACCAYRFRAEMKRDWKERFSIKLKILLFLAYLAVPFTAVKIQSRVLLQYAQSRN